MSTNAGKSLQKKTDLMQKRLNIVLPERTMGRINKVRELTLASSVTDVIKNAILTYEALAEYMAEGNRFYIKKNGANEFTPVNFLFDVQKSDASKNG